MKKNIKSLKKCKVCGNEDLTKVLTLQEQFGVHAITPIDGVSVQPIHYPVLEYPSKIKTFNFDKTELVEGTLMGIKGQYLLLDTGVINIRKFTSYQVAFTA